jgi:AcrR family transcriptional regulator
MSAISTRRTRADGDRSRRTILLAAARLASTRGLARLSIAELAHEAGMSKSGLYAHFGSKEELQLATIDLAGAIYDAEILAPARLVKPGVATLLELTERYIDHLDQRVFAGACFFAAAGAELRDEPGRVRDRVGAFQTAWEALLVEHATLGRDAGELPASEDVEQLAFDLESYLMNAHQSFSFTGNRAVLDRARRAVRRRLGVA